MKKLAVCSLMVGSWLAAQAGDVKIIAHGWDLLDVSPEEVLANADKFDKTEIDGVTLMIDRTLPDGRHISHGRIMNDTLWPRDQLKDVIPVFREIVKHRSLRESFISSWWQPRDRRLKWTDDAAWETFAANMGTVAYLARQGGLRGVLVDGEDYPKARQYVRLEGDPAYDEAAKLARQRGRQVFGAMFREFPDITFLSFWLLSITPEYFTALDPVDMARNRNDLWPAFLNGMLDVLPPTARFVDGNEHAYRYEAARRDFFVSASRQRKNALGLIAPENRAKYRRGLCAGFGLYLDSYVVTNTASQWYMGPLQGSRLAHYRANLAQAVEAADAYVWVYGEQKAWVPWQNLKRKRFVGRPTWEDVLPGFTAAMAGVRDPLAYIDRTFPFGCAARNLCASGACTGKPNGRNLPAGWTLWSDETKRQGTYGIDGATGGPGGSSSLVAKGVEGGCFITNLEGVKAGETYVVTAYGRGSHVSGVVYWKANGKWNWKLPGTELTFTPGGAEEWRRGRAYVTVPEGADTLALQLGVRLDEESCVNYDDVAIYRIP